MLNPDTVVAATAVLAFTEVLADRDTHGKYSLALYDSGRYMRIDSAAQRALNVLRSRTDANDNFSLYGLLNRTRTAMGKRLLKACVRIHGRIEYPITPAASMCRTLRPAAAAHLHTHHSVTQPLQ